MIVCPYPKPIPNFPCLITGTAMFLASYLYKRKREQALIGNDALVRLEQLYQLKKEGAITEEEFNTIKEKLKEQI